MKLYQKDYEHFAYFLNGTRPNADAIFRVKNQWARDVIAVANVLADSNKKFNRNKFYEACGSIDEFLTGQG